MAESLQKAAELVLEARKPELVPQILSKSVPIFEEEKDFEKLRDIYKVCFHIFFLNSSFSKKIQGAL